MSPIVYNMLRSGVQIAWSWLVAHFAVLAFVPSETAVEWILTVLTGVVIVGALRWLETRKGEGLVATWSRRLAALLMAGLSGKQPTYSTPPVADGSVPLSVTYTDPVGGKTLRPSLH